MGGCKAAEYTELKLSSEVTDEAIESAHFLSAPKAHEHKALEREISDYDASCSLSAVNDMGYLVLGDKTGEYGNLFLVGAGCYDGLDRIIIKSYKNGMQDVNNFCLVEDLEITGGSGIFDLEIHVGGGKADIIACGEKVAEAFVPFSDLGCVGACKDRGLGEVFMDNLSVEEKGQVIFADDFDGHFVNELYPYDYEGERSGVFSPSYYKTEEFKGSRALFVPSAILLSETDKDVAPAFRKDFEVKKNNVKSAHLCMTALGSFEAYINSEKVSENFFDPGKMLFDRYLDYVTYDVTPLIKDKNELKIYLFHGFYDKGVGYPEVAGIWGKKLAVKGALIIDYKDGTRDIIPTDESFLASTDTRYRFNDIYQGEIIDDRYREEVWESPEVDSVIDAFLQLPLYPKENESIAPYEYISSAGVSEPVPGHYVYDFTENIAGSISIDAKRLNEVCGRKGQVVTFRYGELLNSADLVNSDGPEGTVWTRNLLTAGATDYYVSGGKEITRDISFSHTYHGFRYLEITGIDKALPADAVMAVAISSDLAMTGEFTCSDDTINTFYDNSLRSIRSNMMDCPTDCAQRDERLGWAGDAQATSMFSMYCFDGRNFYQNYLKQMRLMQDEDGEIYDVAPGNSTYGGHSCWGDAIVTIPWNLYLQYGDKEVLAENAPAGRKWVDYLVENSDDYIYRSGGYADHLSSQETPEELTDTAWCAHSSRLVSKMYKVLGDDELSQKYGEIADAYTASWQKNFIREDHSVEAGILYPDYESETAYALGLEFELFPDDMRQAAGERLKVLSEFSGYLFYPGYSGMEFYLPALCKNGGSDVAAKVMECDLPGGLAHPQSMGLTTNPETVNAFRYVGPSGEEYGGGRYSISCSLNHAAYSAACEVCYTCILGILPDENAPGYEHFYIEPLMTSQLESASGSFDSVRGRISVAWDSTKRELICEVPKGSAATAILPDGRQEELSEGRHSLNW